MKLEAVQGAAHRRPSRKRKARKPQPIRRRQKRRRRFIGAFRKLAMAEIASHLQTKARADRGKVAAGIALHGRTRAERRRTRDVGTSVGTARRYRLERMKDAPDVTVEPGRQAFRHDPRSPHQLFARTALLQSGGDSASTWRRPRGADHKIVIRGRATQISPPSGCSCWNGQNRAAPRELTKRYAGFVRSPSIPKIRRAAAQRLLPRLRGGLVWASRSSTE